MSGEEPEKNGATPSWETYQQPSSSAGEPPPPPYGPPTYDQPSYAQAPAGQPSYSQPPYGHSPYGPYASQHPQANTALVLGLVALIGTFTCGVLCVLGPFAWVTGARVRREIDADPQRWTGRSEATAGLVMGVITTILMVLAVMAVILFFGLFGLIFAGSA